jgi:hypothetical protein
MFPCHQRAKWQELTTPMEPLGIIAGNGEFPLILARSARQLGAGPIVAAAFDGETNPEINQLVDHADWIKLGQLNKLIEVFTSRGVKRAVMAGGITPSNLFKNLRLDLRMTTVALRLKERNAETIFGAIASEMAKDGVELIDPRPFLGESVPPPGVLTRLKPSKDQTEDIEFGLRIARAVSALDIGQTVVVKKGTVLAVEGFEGTDECIRRGGALAGEKGGALVVKVSKPEHDFRFDIPCVGEKTIESCRVARISVMAVEAGRSLLLDKDKLLKAANEAGMCLVAVPSE